MSNLELTVTAEQTLVDIRKLLASSDDFSVTYSQGIQEVEGTGDWAKFEGDGELTITIKLRPSP